MLPQTNATLTAVNAEGSEEDFDYEGGSGAVKWAGSAPAYLQEKRERVAGATESAIVLRRSLIVHTRDPAIDWEDEDVVTFVYDGASRTGKVALVERHELAGTGAVETTRLTLADA